MVVVVIVALVVLIVVVVVAGDVDMEEDEKIRKQGGRGIGGRIWGSDLYKYTQKYAWHHSFVHTRINK